MGCRIERARQWSVRNVHESKMHERNSFLTLTIAPKHMPADWSLDHKHWQEFAYRLRQYLQKLNKLYPTHPASFRFFMTGEYGDDKDRPHYHCLMYGLDFTGDRKYLTTTKRGDKLYTSETLDKLWKLGTCQIGDLTPDSVAYVCRYALKKKTHDSEQLVDQITRVNTQTGEVHLVKPPYIQMSRRPGIGATWYNKFKTDVHTHDYVVDNKGFKSPPPAFYDRMLARDDPEALEILKRRRIAVGKTHQANNTPNRLADRETIAKRKLAKLPTREPEPLAPGEERSLNRIEKPHTSTSQARQKRNRQWVL